MKRWLSIAAVLALAAAKPEMYKESEDFQFSRSSSDEGHKSGYYGAQRGNMGGNYERAHNMDGLAQHQLSGAVRQVEGELGEAANTRTGSVYTAANSGGIYGSGKYDLSNLQGRNFQEGATFDDSHSHISQSSHNSAYSDHSAAAMHSSGYQALNSGSAYSGYQGRNNYRQSLQTDNLQAIDNVHGTSSYGYGQGTQSATAAVGQNSGHYLQSGYRAQNGYDSSNINQYNSNAYRLNPTSSVIIATPVRIYGRPGQRVAIPVGIQTYDATHSASTVDRNAINSEAEILTNADQNVNYIPSTNSKHHESSYTYRKQWEKHNTSPEVVALSTPTENPFPNKNSELYDSTQVANNQYHSSGLNSLSAQSRRYSGYNANTKTSSSNQAHFQAGSESQHSSAVSGLNSNAYTQDAANFNHRNSALDTTNALGSADTTPRSYQSSYSYHKSWERQGDPYVIQPVSGTTNGLESQRLTAATKNNGYSSHRYGTHYAHGTEVDCDCDENGLVRVARSAPTQYDTYKQDQYKNDFQEIGQEAQNTWTNSGAYGQNKLDRIEDLGQQTQNQWEDLGQQTQNQWEGLGQQTQNQFESLGQQAQKQWQDYGPHLEDLGQQTQNNFEDLGQQTQNNFEDLGQQTQNNFEDLGQQTQNNFEGLGQQTQNNFEDLGQQTQNNFENLSQQTQNTWQNLDQQTQDRWDKIHPGQEQTDLGQQIQEPWSNAERLEDQSQQTDGSWVGTGDLRQEFQNPWDTWQGQNQINSFNETSSNKSDQNQNNNYQQNTWDSAGTFESQSSHQNPITWDQQTPFQEQGTQVFDHQSNYSPNDNNQQINEGNGHNHEQQTSQQVSIDWNQQNTFNDQETQMFDSQSVNNDQQTIGENVPIFDTQHSHYPVTWNQGVEKTEKFEQNYLNSQNYTEETGQQVHNSWDMLDIVDKNKSIEPNIRPVWEQSEDMHQTADKTDLTNVNNEASTYFNFGGHESQNTNENIDWSSLTEINNKNASFSNLWDKINDFDNKNSRNDYNTVNSSSNQQRYHSESSYSASNFNYSQNSYTSSQSHVGENPNQDIAYNEETQPWRKAGDKVAIPTSIAVTTTSTNKPDNLTQIQHVIENVQPLDIGRGDIGPDEIVKDFTITDKSYNPLEIQQQSSISMGSNVFKTPEEIDALSLTKENDKNISANVNNQQIQNDQHNHSEKYNDSSENVLSVNKWLESEIQNAQSPYEEGQRNYSIHEYHSEFQNQQVESHKFIIANTSSYNKQDKFKFDSQSTDFSQLSQELSNIEQELQNQHFDQTSVNSYQQSEDLNQNIQQQSETVWGQNLKEFLQGPEGREPQLAESFGQYEMNHHEKDIQLAESFKRSHAQLTDDFYHQNHLLPRSSQQQNPDVENIQELETTHKIEDLQSPQKNNDINQPLETTTQKAGFWASVGSKLGNAKNKVTSWFKSS